jgi:hypothetical protein
VIFRRIFLFVHQLFVFFDGCQNRVGGMKNIIQRGGGFIQFWLLFKKARSTSLLIQILPVSAVSCPAIIFNKVDLPEPLRATRAILSPSEI